MGRAISARYRGQGTEGGVAPSTDLQDNIGLAIAPSKKLAKVKSVKDKDAEHGFGPQQDDAPVDVQNGQVVKLPSKPEKGPEKPH